MGGWLKISSLHRPFAWWKRCVLCLTATAVSETRLCTTCAARLRSIARPIKPEAKVTSLYRYRPPMRDLLLRAKVKSDHRALDLLAELVVTHPAALALAAWADDLIVCPSSLWGRLRGRLDVAFHIGTRIAAHVDRPVRSAPPHLYWRLRKRARHKRHAAEAGVHVPRPWRATFDHWQRRLHRELDRPLRLLIIDDVTTTGQTLRAVARHLPEEAEVRVLTLAAGQIKGLDDAFGLPRSGAV